MSDSRLGLVCEVVKLLVPAAGSKRNLKVSANVFSNVSPADHLVEFVFSIPDEYKLDNRLYSVMLHKFFPKFYKDIPWQQTGKPAGVIKPNPLPYRIANKVRWVFCKMGLLSSPQLFTNYPEWIRDKATKSKIEDLLLPGDSFVNKSFQDNRAKKLLSAHASRLSDHSNEILKLVTIEVYWRRVATL